MHPGVILAEQLLGVGDQRIEVFLALLLGLVVLAIRRRQAGRAGEDLLDADLGEAVLVGIAHPAAHVDDVVALVGVGREGDLDAEEGEVAQPGRQRQDVHLTASVIDVVLARHVVACKGEHVRQRGAVGRAAAVADVQRAGRIGGDELHLHLHALGGAAAEVRALAEHLAHDSGLGVGGEGEIDESGTGDFGLGDQFRGRQLGQQQVGELARVALERLSQLQREVGSEIAVARLLRALQQDRGVGQIGRHALQRGVEQIGQQDFWIGAHGTRNEFETRDYSGRPATAPARL